MKESFTFFKNLDELNKILLKDDNGIYENEIAKTPQKNGVISNKLKE